METKTHGFLCKQKHYYIRVLYTIMFQGVLRKIGLAKAVRKLTGVKKRTTKASKKRAASKKSKTKKARKGKKRSRKQRGG